MRVARSLLYPLGGGALFMVVPRQMTVVTVVGLTINSGGKVFDMIFFLG